jgi:hypothetical protein
MKIKIVTSLSIFLLLLTIAWMLNKKEMREFYRPDEEGEVVQILTTNPNTEGVQKRKYRMFKAREYVRIERP